MKELAIVEIKSMIAVREKYFSARNETWDEELGEYGHEPEEIDIIAKQIEEALRKYKELLDIDFIIESLTELGDAPSILYDDNGHFAISSGCIQSVCMEDEPEDFTISHFVEKGMFRDTIREALYKYLDQ